MSCKISTELTIHLNICKKHIHIYRKDCLPFVQGHINTNAVRLPEL